MQTHTQTQTQSQRPRDIIFLDVAASFVASNGMSPWDALRVPSVEVTVRYRNGRPVVGLAWENLIIVNAEESCDLTYLLCVTGFRRLPTAGKYEIAVSGARWHSQDTASHRCVVHVTRVVESNYAIELGHAVCCL